MLENEKYHGSSAATVSAMSDTPEDLLHHQHMLPMRHEGIISNEQSDDVQKGNDAETLNSMRTAHIENAIQGKAENQRG